MSQWVNIVRQFADNVLKYGRDRRTPLLADGINVATREPVEWQCDGERWVVSNLACQQNLFRTLVGLSNLTGDARYRDAAVAATGYMLEHYRRSCGLLQWGGHRFVDLRTGRVVGEQDCHEFKCTYPFYDLLWEVDASAAVRFVEALWNAHVLDWRTLDMNRHGAYDKPMGALWASEFTGAPPFFEGRGLTFINCGSDLIYAAGWLATKTGQTGPRTWARRLAEQYVRARDPRTGLGAYQFSQTRRERAPRDDNDTASNCGDRARRQLGPEFGERALEGRVLDPGRAEVIYGKATVAQLRLGDRQLLEWAVAGLRAFAQHAYDPATNQVRAMFTDGTPLSPADVKRPGYYTPEVFAPRPAGPRLLLAYALAWRLSGDDALREIAEQIARRVDEDALTLLARLEIYRASKDRRDLEWARRLAEQIVRERYRDGFFFSAAGLRNAQFDRLEPLALLALEAAERGEPDAVPEYPGGAGHIHGPYDGLGRTYDREAIWGQRE